MHISNKYVCRGRETAKVTKVVAHKKVSEMLKITKDCVGHGKRSQVIKKEHVQLASHCRKTASQNNLRLMKDGKNKCQRSLFSRYVQK